MLSCVAGLNSSDRAVAVGGVCVPQFVIVADNIIGVVGSRPGGERA